MLSAFYCLFDKGSKKRVNKKCYEKKSMLLFFKVLFYSQRVVLPSWRSHKVRINERIKSAMKRKVRF